MQGELIEALAASLPSPEGLTSLAGATGGRGGDEEAARLRLWAHAALFVVETEGAWWRDGCAIVFFPLGLGCIYVCFASLSLTHTHTNTPLSPPPTTTNTGRRAFRRQGPHVQAKVFAVLKHYMRRCLWKGEQEGEERMEGLPSPSHVPLLALYASFLPARDRRRLFSEYMEGALLAVCVVGVGGVGVCEG